MPKAVWNGAILAASRGGQVVEGNYHVPLAGHVAFWKEVRVDER
jgi:hypothetical protein